MGSIFRSVSGRLVLAKGTAITCILIAYTAFNVAAVKERTVRDVMALAAEKPVSSARIWQPVLPKRPPQAQRLPPL